MSKPDRAVARRLVTSHPYWQRLRWDDEDWSRHTLTDIDDTIKGVVRHASGQELVMISALTEMLDEDVYSNCFHISLSRLATPSAQAFAAEINQDKTCGDALRAAMEVAEDLEGVIIGLIEVALSHYDAWGAVSAE